MEKILPLKIFLQNRHRPVTLKEYDTGGLNCCSCCVCLQDNHVIKYTPREAYAASYLGEKQRGAIFTGPGSMKAANICGLISVGAVSSDPQKYTKVRHEKKTIVVFSMRIW